LYREGIAPQSFDLHGLAGHLAASLGATTARLGAALTVIHVMRVALFRTPVADVRAQFAHLPGEWTVACDRIDAKPADCRALDAAGRTAIIAFLADHMAKQLPHSVAHSLQAAMTSLAL